MWMTLAVIWGVAVLIGGIMMGKSMLDDLGFGFAGNTIFIVVIGPILLLVAGMPAGVLMDEQSPVLATLHKADWSCAGGHNQTGMVMAGKVMVPTTTFVCDQYNRK